MYFSKMQLFYFQHFAQLFWKQKIAVSQLRETAIHMQVVFNSIYNSVNNLTANLNPISNA